MLGWTSALENRRGESLTVIKNAGKPVGAYVALPANSLEKAPAWVGYTAATDGSPADGANLSRGAFVRIDHLSKDAKKAAEAADVHAKVARMAVASADRSAWPGIPYVVVADTDATVKLATELNGTVLTKPTDIPNVGRFALLTDPQGAVFAVIKMAATVGPPASPPRRPARRRGRRWLRWLVGGALGVCLLLTAAVIVLRLMFHGEALGSYVSELLNKKMRGRVEIRSIEWPLSALTAAATGGWIPVTIRDVKVWDDSEPRKLVLQAPEITARLDAHSFLFGNHDYVAEDLHIVGGGYLLLHEEKVKEAYKLHPYDVKDFSILSAFRGRPTKQSFRAGIFATGGPVFDLRNLQVDDLTVELVLPETETNGVFHHVTSKGGFFYADPRDPLTNTVYYSLGVDASDGQLSILGKYTIDLVDIEFDRLAQLPMRWPDDPVGNDVQFRGTASTPARVGPARIRIDGMLRDYWEPIYGGTYDVAIDLANAGPLLTDQIDPTIGGADVHAVIDIDGPQLRPRYAIQLTGVRYQDVVVEGKPPLVLDLEKLNASYDDATESGVVEDTLARGSGGAVSLAAKFDTNPLRVDGTLQIVEPLNVGTYLPAALTQALGTKLTGGLHFRSDENANRYIDRMRLALGPATLKGRLYIENDIDVWRTDKTKDKKANEAAIPGQTPEPLQLTLGLTTLTAEGQIDFAENKPTLDIDIAAGDLGRWLARLDLPAFGHSLAGTVHVGGTLDALLLDTEDLELDGVPVVGAVQTALTYAVGANVVDIHDVHTTGLGGRLAGHGKIDLGETPQLRDFHVDGSGIELSRLPALDGLVAGTTGAVSIDASGPFDRLDGHLVASAANLEVLGDGFTGIRLDATSRRGATSIELDATRKRGGSINVCTRLDARQRFVEPDNSCRGVIVRDLALDNMAMLRGPDGVPLAGGTVNAMVAPEGSLDELSASGVVRLAQGWLAGAFIGMGEVTLTAASDGAIALHGTLLQGNVSFDAVLATAAPYQTTMTARFDGLDLDAFLPEVAARFGAQAWVTGTLAMTMPLAGDAVPHGSIVLERAVLSVARTDELGRPQPLRVENAGDIHLAFAGETVCFDRNQDQACDVRDEEIEAKAARAMAMAKAAAPPAAPPCEGAHFLGAGGNFCLLGSSRPEALAIAVRGAVAIDFLAPYLREYFDHVEGTLRVDVAVRGTMAAPAIEAKIDVDGVEVRSTGQEAVVRVDNGRIEISNQALSVTNLIVQMEDKFNGEKAELAVRGNVALHDLRPSAWGMQIEGRLAGKMLLAFAPTFVSSASGAAEVEISLQGRGEVPVIDGTIDFATDNPLTFTPRGLRREVVLSGGTVSVVENTESRRLGDKKILVEGVTGKIDEGRLRSVDGEASLADWAVADLDVIVSADNLPFRVPGTLELTANAEALHVISGPDGLALAGRVVVVDGRYFRRVDPIGDFLRPAASTVSAPPFYESDPLLANADLDLAIEVRSFSVANNIANIELSTSGAGIVIRGTPRAPRFDDQVVVRRGTFSLPAIRATFTRTSGTVTFSPQRKFPDSTPTLDLRSEADFRDSSGVDHLITLTVTGSLGEVHWDLSTSRGLNKGQTIALLLSGQTTSDLLTDDALDRDPSKYDPRLSQEAGYTEQLLRDVAGDLFTDITDDALRNATKLDVFRLEVGTGSVGLHVEKELLPNLNLMSEVELTGQGRVWDSRGTMRLLDALSVEGQFTQKRPDDTAEVDTDDLRFRLVYRYIFP